MLVALHFKGNPISHFKTWDDGWNSQEELMSLATRLCNRCIEEEKRCVFIAASVLVTVQDCFFNTVSKISL